MGYDAVKPDHYKVGDSYEHYKVVREWDLTYCLGCATKYISRVGRKPGTNPVEDLRKAIRFIEMEIDNIQHRNQSRAQVEEAVPEEKTEDWDAPSPTWWPTGQQPKLNDTCHFANKLWRWSLNSSGRGIWVRAGPVIPRSLSK